MVLLQSRDFSPGPVPDSTKQLLARLNPEQLRRWVEQHSKPRHFLAEPAQNRAAADWIASSLAGFGLRVEVQGPHRNIIAKPQSPVNDLILVAAHYDSVPGCPGADDNASAVAAMLGCAALCSSVQTTPSVMFAAFNREEEGMIGSSDFVASVAHDLRVRCAHILEMVGYASREPGSQRVPTGLPIQLNPTGDFLGLLANSHSAASMKAAVQTAAACQPGFPVTGLIVPPGAEQVLPVLARSDHAPFWAAGIPAVMWTDTAEFRNPHYHKPSDTPDTLDYGFLADVTRVLAATVLQS